MDQFKRVGTVDQDFYRLNLDSDLLFCYWRSDDQQVTDTPHRFD